MRTAESTHTLKHTPQTASPLPFGPIPESTDTLNPSVH